MANQGSLGNFGYFSAENEGRAPCGEVYEAGSKGAEAWKAGKAKFGGEVLGRSVSKMLLGSS